MFSWLKKTIVFSMAIVILLVAVSCIKQTGDKQDNNSKQLEEDKKKEKKTRKAFTLNEKEYELIELIIEEGLLMMANYSEEGVHSIIDSGYPYVSFQAGKAYLVDNGENNLKLLLGAIVNNLVEPAVSLEKSSKLFSEAVKSKDYGNAGQHEKNYKKDFERLKYLCSDQCFYVENVAPLGFMVSMNDGSMEFNQNKFEEFRSNFIKSFVLALKYRDEKIEEKKSQMLEQERQIKEEQEFAKQGIYKVPNVVGLSMDSYIDALGRRVKTPIQILQDKGFSNINAKLTNGERLKELYRDENDYIYFNCQVVCEYRTYYQGVRHYWNVNSRCKYVKEQYPEEGGFLLKNKDIELIIEYSDPETVCKNSSGQESDREYFYKYAVLDIPESKFHEIVKNHESESYVDNILRGAVTR